MTGGSGILNTRYRSERLLFIVTWKKKITKF